VPREKAVFRREASDGEHFDRLVAKQGPESGCCRFGIAQRECRNAYHPAFVVAERAVGANEFADTMAASVGFE
jgi:hypothetical protein